jgi:hypothetical protein
MRSLIVLGTALALAGCGERADTVAEATPTATATADTPSPAANQSATGDMTGRYEVTLADGSVISETINADGTYVDVMDGEETRGRWRMDGAKSCFDPDGDAPEECYTSAPPAADGSFVVTSADGRTRSTVRKVGAAPEA